MHAAFVHFVYIRTLPILPSNLSLFRKNKMAACMRSLLFYIYGMCPYLPFACHPHLPPDSHLPDILRKFLPTLPLQAK